MKGFNQLTIHAINLRTSGLFKANVDLLKCTEQNVNNQSLTQVSQLYVHFVFFKVIRSRQNMPTGGHGHVMCMVVNAVSTIHY